jgi:hypothetical protein
MSFDDPTSPDYDRPFGGIGIMVVVTAAILFLVFVVAVGTAVVKAYEWRQDVLYGPYIGRNSERNQATDRSF